MNSHGTMDVPVNEPKIMKIRKVCCFELRTCGFIIACLELASVLLFLGSDFGVVYSLVKIVVVGCLLYGIHKRKPKFLTPYLVENSFTIFVGIVAVIMLMISSTGSAGLEVDESLEGNETLIIITAIIAVAFSVHSWLVIYTLHQEYTQSQVILFGGPYSNVTVHPIVAEPRVATIKNGIVLTQQYDSPHGRH